MSLTSDQLQHMDSLTGLSNIQKMDQVVGVQSQPKSPDTLTSKTNSFLDNTLGKIPGVGGVANWLGQSVTEPVTGYVDQMAQKNQQLQDMAKTNPQAAVQELNKSMPTGNLFGVGDLITGQGTARQALPAALDVASLAAVPGMAKGAVNLAKQIPKVAQLATKKGTYKAIAGAAEKATQEGSNIKWSEMQNEIKSAVMDKLGATKEVKKAINTLLSEKTPAEMGTPSLNPNDLLKWRQQIGARGAGKGIMQSFIKGSDIEDKVNSVARSVISKNLKGIAPDISTPDKVYSFYSKFHGDIPTWATRIIGASLAEKLFGSQIKGAVSGLLK